MSQNEKPGALSRMPPNALVGDPSRIPQPLSGLSFLARAQYKAYEKEFAAYLKLLRTRNEVGQALEDAAKIAESFEKQLVRIERLPEIRQIEQLKVQAELEGELDKFTARATQRELSLIKQRADKANMTASAILAERRLVEIENPPAIPLAYPEPAGPPEPLGARIAAIRRDESDFLAELMQGYEQIDDMPEAERELIDRIKLKTADLIAELIESRR